MQKHLGVQYETNKEVVSSTSDIFVIYYEQKLLIKKVNNYD